MPPIFASTPILDALLKDRPIDPDEEEGGLHQLNITANTRGNPHDGGTTHMTNAEFFGQLPMQGPTIDELRQDRKDAISGAFDNLVSSMEEAREQETRRNMASGERIEDFFSGLLGDDEQPFDRPATAAGLTREARRPQREAQRASTARDATSVSIPQEETQDSQETSQRMGIQEPQAQLTKRPTRFAFQDDIMRVIHRNPLLKAVATMAGTIHPADATPAGGLGRAALRFIPKASLGSMPSKAGDEVVEFALKDPTNALSPTSTGVGLFRPRMRPAGAGDTRAVAPNTPQDFVIDIMDTRGPAGLEPLITVQQGHELAERGIGYETMGRRGILEAFTDLVRQRPGLQRITSNNRIAGKGIRGLQNVDRRVTEGIRSRADAARAAQGSRPSALADEQLRAYRILRHKEHFDPEQVVRARDYLLEQGLSPTEIADFGTSFNKDAFLMRNQGIMETLNKLVR